MNQQLVQELLKNTGFSSWNTLQQTAIDHKKSANLLILAPTGSGKTLAFLVPLILRLKKEIPGTQSLILAPTRELALQIEQVFKSLKSGWSVTTCYGGHSMRTETNNLSENPCVVIGTPGRIADHVRRENINLKNISQLVIDEYDKCLELGFEEQLQEILEPCRKIEFRTFVSATVLDTFPSYLHFHPVETIRFLNQKQPEISYFKVDSGNYHFRTAFQLVCSFQEELSIIFCNFREASVDFCEYLNELGIPALYYHGGMEQEERERTLIKFRNGSCHTLVCTDLGSRGLDIPAIKHVVHLQYPQSEEAFIHRNGRTARMEENGNVYLLEDEQEKSREYLENWLEKAQEFKLPGKEILPEIPEWTTLYFSSGKKDKVNKIDLVGFLTQKGNLPKEDIGLITVLDFASYVAIRNTDLRKLLATLRVHKVKGKKLRISISK